MRDNNGILGLKPSFIGFVKGKTKEEARAQLEKEQLPKLRSLARLLHQPLYELNLKCGNITVEDFVTYQSLYR